MWDVALVIGTIWILAAVIAVLLIGSFIRAGRGEDHED